MYINQLFYCFKVNLLKRVVVLWKEKSEFLKTFSLNVLDICLT